MSNPEHLKNMLRERCRQANAFTASGQHSLAMLMLDQARAIYKVLQGRARAERALT